MGSFISVVSYRFPRGIDFVKGRSFCPKCKGKVVWFDNIPIISFILLGGKCRQCKKTISFRYPFIELVTGLLFLLTYLISNNCGISLSPVCYWEDQTGKIFLLVFLCLLFINLLIFVVDLERQFIPDIFTYLMVGLIFLCLLLTGSPRFYWHLFSALAGALILLIIHFITRGKGMGLGDVKYALVPGLLLGWPMTLIWLFTAFLTGGLAAVILILLGRAKAKDKIAFGPFLVFAFISTLFFGDTLLKWLGF